MPPICARQTGKLYISVLYDERKMTPVLTVSGYCHPCHCHLQHHHTPSPLHEGCCWALMLIHIHTFFIILLLPLWKTHSALFSLIKSLSFALPFPSDSHSRVLNPPNTRKALRNLSCVTADEVRRLVLLAPCKSSHLDPIPTSLVKDCSDILKTPITSIINVSLTEGFFPSHLKSAHVSPV